jgi:hypoxanthine phosphoribosyltransferase
VKRLLTWDDFNEAVEVLSKQVRGFDIQGVYGVPRGGMPLAVALSHALDLPLLTQIGWRALIVDDIADSGQTIRLLQGLWPKSSFAVWVKRPKCNLDVVHVIMEPSEAWIVFPWEKVEHADKDAAAYAASRGDDGRDDNHTQV